MHELLIRNVPDTLMKQLNRRAACRTSGTRHIEDIVAERRTHSHITDAQVPYAVDIIRADRDAR